MFCIECGKEIPVGSSFCIYCGAKLEEEEEISEVVSSESPQIVHTEEREIVNKKSIKIPKGVAIGLPVGILVVVGIIFFFVLRPITIDMSDYVSVNFEGYNSLGKATIEYDRDRLKDDYCGKIRIDISEYTKDLEDADYYDDVIDELDDSTVMDILCQCIQVETDQEKNLSNGDVVTISFETDEEKLKEIFNVQLKERKIETEVFGLEEIETFDPFENVEVMFSGIAPNGSMNIEKMRNSSEYSEIRFSSDNFEGLSNGDTVTVIAELSCTENQFIERFGKLPAPKEKQYTVNGLMSYITKSEEIADELLDIMKSQAQDVVYANASKNLDVTETILSCDYRGYYFLNRKSGASGKQNFITLVYEVDVRQDFEDRDKQQRRTNVTYFYPVTFYELMLDEDGNGIVDISNYGTPSNMFEFYTGYYRNNWGDEKYYIYYGYEKLELVKNEFVTKNLDKYTYEDCITYENTSTSDEASLSDFDDADFEDWGEDDLSESVNNDSADYILPYSDSRYYKKSDLEGFSARECMLARNELYARYGRKFKDETIREYFESKDWYEGRIDPKDFDENCLNEYETANRDLIVSYEEEQGYK